MSGPQRRKDGSTSASSGSSRHEAGCECTRCAGFQEGNAVAVRHGVHALQRLAPAAQEASEFLAATLPRVETADAALLGLMAMDLARLRAAESWRSEHGTFQAGGISWPFEVDIAKVASRFARCCERFGGSPAARVELGAILAGDVLGNYVRATYGDQTLDGSVVEIEAATDA